MILSSLRLEGKEAATGSRAAQPSNTASLQKISWLLVGFWLFAALCDELPEVVVDTFKHSWLPKHQELSYLLFLNIHHRCSWKMWLVPVLELCFSIKLEHGALRWNGEQGKHCGRAVEPEGCFAESQLWGTLGCSACSSGVVDLGRTPHFSSNKRR